jgi:hypothetical protein
MLRNRTRAIIVVVAALGIALSCWGFAGQQTQTKPLVDKAKIPVLCSDFKTTLDLQKNNDGSVVMTARICNIGPGGYSYTATPLQGYFMVYTWHPPHTPAQEANLKFTGYTDLGTAMKAQECKGLKSTYQVENFSRWGTFPNSSTERQAMKEFVALVERKNGPGFTSCEDTDINNSKASIDVPYMEKIK